ncbi:MAG: acetolactate decarboxylase [Desulfovibrio sp.]
MRRLFLNILPLLLVALLLPCAAGAVSYSIDLDPTHDVLYQISTVSKLKDGYYDSEQTVADIKKRGDFGMGTFQGLDGEMFFYQGRVWQIPVTGVPQMMPDSAGVPFAQVTHFEPDLIFTLRNIKDYADFEQKLLKELPGPDMIYAVHVKGAFSFVKARSVPKSEKPFPKLADVIAKQAIFPLTNVVGDMVGWHTPAYMTGVGAAGPHLHFLDQTETKGGHVLDFSAAEVTVELDVTPVLEIQLNKNSAY